MVVTSRPCALGGQRQARQHAACRPPRRCRPARALVAALLGAGQAEVVAQRVEQRHPALQPQPPPGPVDTDRDLELHVGPPVTCSDVGHAPIVRPISGGEPAPPSSLGLLGTVSARRRDQIGQATQCLLGRTARVGMVDDQGLSFGARDREPLDMDLERADQRMVDRVGGETVELDVVARPQAPEGLAGAQTARRPARRGGDRRRRDRPSRAGGPRRCGRCSPSRGTAGGPRDRGTSPGPR